jgi:hypothetical protein
MGGDQGSRGCRLRDDGAGGGRGVAPGVRRHIVDGVGRRGGGVDDDLGFENGVDEDACLPRLSRDGGAAFGGYLVCYRSLSSWVRQPLDQRRCRW